MKYKQSFSSVFRLKFILFENVLIDLITLSCVIA